MDASSTHQIHVKHEDELYKSMTGSHLHQLNGDFVDETRSFDDGDSAMGLEPRVDDTRLLPNQLTTLQQAIMSLSEPQRKAHVYQVLQSLHTSSVAEIVDTLYPRLHLDPIRFLPPELTSLIFAYLSPETLSVASRISKAWRERTLDSSLWRNKFLAEGWKLDTMEVIRAELARTRRLSSKSGRVRKGEYLEHNAPKKRHTLKHEDTTASASTQSQDEEMTDVGRSTMDPPSPPSSTRVEPSEGYVSDIEMDIDSQPSPVFLSAARSDVRMNYQYVYRQRRRLEENWVAGKYKSFQLPHQDHPEDAHNECVYTIQFSGKYLVSGSRDKTLRIWDLETQRLIRRPLSGHNGSVLCLQFDASPEEDIIISGSSDTDVIIWQFSTGKMLRRIQKAHQESVLNVKFDKRYLVTCSKDKLIKVWNRHSIRPGDNAYPVRGELGGAKFPDYILDLKDVQRPEDMERYFSPEQLIPVPEFSMIMTIDLHAAAVNAVHIYKDELVSASGDRDIKVFNIKTGVQVALCKGHNKGIACVQYDGLRIVSGSSDDTIRIFDPKSQAEVACLKGHNKLVRTIQASFGDRPGDEEELAKEARRIDWEVFEAQFRGEIPEEYMDRRRRRERNAGSSKPQDVMATGAHLPPGGGGSPWAKIVSGSYDETVIVWRKAKDGRWMPQHTLKQAEALLAAGPALMTRSERLELAARAPQRQMRMAQLQAQQQLARQHQAQQMQAGPSNAGGPIHAQPQQLMPAPLPPIFPMQPGPRPRAQTQVGAHLAPFPALPHMLFNHHHDAHHPGQNARIFKLQFDARRIVACSQDPKIVGWDFANGDKEIIECSRFFAQTD